MLKCQIQANKNKEINEQKGEYDWNLVRNGDGFKPMQE